MHKNEEIEFLLKKYLDNECTIGEAKKLMEYFEDEENKIFLKDTFEKHLNVYTEDQRYEKILDDVYGKLAEQIEIQDSLLSEQNSTPFSHRRIWYKISIAAAILFLFSSIGYFSVRKKSPQNIHRQMATNNLESQDIQPGVKDALLSFGNGQTINLDKEKNGKLIQFGNVAILKEGNNIIYKRVKNIKNEINPVFTTVTTMRGNEYHIVMEDGTQVWLNAESSIKFPAAFSRGERRVEFSGEAYFEVAKIPSMPFKIKVETDKSQIEVLGTHFNVSAYPEDGEVKTTLLEGAVKIKKDNETKLLSPGEQATNSKTNIQVNKNINIEEVMGWKDGLFVFDRTNIKVILQQMARWYNVNVVYDIKDSLVDGFTGKISKKLPLSEFLKVLELNGVHSRIDGRDVIVEF